MTVKGAINISHLVWFCVNSTRSIKKIRWSVLSNMQKSIYSNCRIFFSKCRASNKFGIVSHAHENKRHALIVLHLKLTCLLKI